jgi:hypothetical protein
MESPTTEQRRVPLASHALFWMIGPIVLALRGSLVQLAAPLPCAGALDLAAISILRAFPELTAGRLVSVMQIACVTLALGFFAELAFRATGNRVIAVLAGLALGASRPFVAVFALPSSAAVLGATAAASLAALALLRRPTRGRTAIAIFALLVAASIVPPLSLAFAAVTVLLMMNTLSTISRSFRLGRALLASAIVIVLPLLVVRAVNVNPNGSTGAWFACMEAPQSGTAVGLAAGSVMDIAGPLILALAVFGAYRSALRTTWKPVAFGEALLAYAVALSLGQRWPAAMLLAPLVIAIWISASVGMLELVRVATDRPTVVLACGLVAAVPILQVTHVRADERDDVTPTNSQERASLSQIRTILNLIPPHSTFVAEDASVDLLLRAAVFGRRTTKPFAIVPRTREAVLAATTRGQVFAFPAGERELALRGFAFEPVPDPTSPRSRTLRGVAAISATRACVALTHTWSDLDGIGAHGRIALSADSDAANGPAIVYFEGESGYTPGPDGWPPRVVWGFDLRMFPRRTPQEADRIEAEAAEAGLRGHPAFASAYVARLTLYRTPHAPLTLPIILGPPRAHGVGRLRDADALPLTLCDAPNVDISQF